VHRLIGLGAAALGLAGCAGGGAGNRNSMALTFRLVPLPCQFELRVTSSWAWNGVRMATTRLLSMTFTNFELVRRSATTRVSPVIRVDVDGNRVACAEASGAWTITWICVPGSGRSLSPSQVTRTTQMDEMRRPPRGYQLTKGGIRGPGEAHTNTKSDRLYRCGAVLLPLCFQKNYRAILSSMESRSFSMERIPSIAACKSPPNVVPIGRIGSAAIAWGRRVFRMGSRFFSRSETLSRTRERDAEITSIFSGATLFAIGVIGEYLARVFVAVTTQPPYLVRSVVGDGDADGTESHRSGASDDPTP